MAMRFKFLPKFFEIRFNIHVYRKRFKKIKTAKFDNDANEREIYL